MVETIMVGTIMVEAIMVETIMVGTIMVETIMVEAIMVGTIMVGTAMVDNYFSNALSMIDCVFTCLTIVQQHFSEKLVLSQLCIQRRESYQLLEIMQYRRFLHVQYA